MEGYQLNETSFQRANSAAFLHFKDNVTLIDPSSKYDNFCPLYVRRSLELRKCQDPPKRSKVRSNNE